MAYIREASIERALVMATETRGGIAYKLTVPGRRNAPDRLLILPGGRMIFVECKAPGQKPRPGQTREHNRLRALGCEMHVLDSIDNDWIFDGKPEDWPEFHDESLDLQPAQKPLPPELKKKPAPVLCKVEDCSRMRYSFGYCLRHWREYKANGKV